MQSVLAHLGSASRKPSVLAPVLCRWIRSPLRSCFVRSFVHLFKKKQLKGCYYGDDYYYGLCVSRQLGLALEYLVTFRFHLLSDLHKQAISPCVNVVSMWNSFPMKQRHLINTETMAISLHCVNELHLDMVLCDKPVLRKKQVRRFRFIYEVEECWFSSLSLFLSLRLSPSRRGRRRGKTRLREW